MNAAARALSETNWVKTNVLASIFTRKTFATLVLLVSVLVSAVAVVFLKAYNRNLFSDLQIEQGIYGQLEIQRGQLLLEQSTLATPSRIKMIASRDLHMITPLPNDIVVVRSESY